MKKIIGILVLFSVLFLLVGCTMTTIANIKANPDKYVGQKVTVSGTVKNTIKIGSLSGYTLDDNGNSIGVSSKTLPAEGSTITITGTVMKDTIFGYYILTQ